MKRDHRNTNVYEFIGDSVRSVRKFVVIRYSIITCLIFMLFSSGFYAQGKDELDSLIIKGRGTFKPTITEGVRITETPSYTDSTQRIPEQKYSITSKQLPVYYQLAPIKSAKMVGEPLTKLYNAMIKVGYGNYNTPYGELFLNNLRSKEWNYGIHAKHLSSSATLKDRGFSGFSEDEASIYSKRFFAKHTFLADLDYTRNVVHYYGYDATVNKISKATIKQTFDFINPRLRFMSHFADTTKLNYDLRFNYYNINDLYKTSENNVLVEGLVKGYYDKQLISVLGGVDFYNTRQLGDTLNNTIVKLNPNIAFSGNKWNVNVGVTATGDFRSSNSKFYFYPSIDFNYNVINNIIIPYAGITGNLQKNSYKSMSDINQFVTSSVVLQNTNNKIEFYAGFRGTVEANTSYNIKATYSKIDSALFFANDYSEVLSNRFKAVYDNVSLLNLHGEIGYQKTEKLKILAKGDFFHYNMKTETRPWNIPEMKITLSTQYSMRNKVVAKFDMFVIGKRYAKPNGSNTLTPIELKGVADINVGVQYNYTKLFSFFANFNNIASVRYYRWNGYPSQRFNFLAGLTITF